MTSERGKAAVGTESGAVGQLTWPPPGLERMQGDLMGIAFRAALAGGFLAMPLLFVVARDQEFATLGPFADAWWVTILLATVGLAFGLDAIIRMSRTLKRAGRAIERGYDSTTVLRVLADWSRDTGFLLTGARHFSVMDAREREAIAAIRVAAAVLLAFAGLWLVLSLAVGLFLAARGLVSPTGLRYMTLAVPALAYVAGGVATLVQEGRAMRARKVWHNQPWADDLTAHEIEQWRTATSESLAGGTPASGSRTGRILVGLSVVVAASTVLLAAPVLTLVPASAVGPILTAVSVPGYDRYRPRAARTQAFRSFVTTGDVSITPEEAGQLLHDLIYVGLEDEPSPGERPPSRRVTRPWIPVEADTPNPMGLDPFAWGDSLLEVISEGVTPAQRAYLQGLSTHPSSADFSRLAAATALDVGSARWDTPFPAGLTMATMPLPRFRGLRDAANVHLAAAGVALADGRHTDAERLLTEIISVGFLLGDGGPTLIDNFIGYSLIEAGGAALADFYRLTGRTASAAELSRLNQVADLAAGMMQVEIPRGPETFVRSLPGMVLDTTLVRGLRWEYFINLATMVPCLNMHRMVFGSSPEYDAFVMEARASLVRWPSEEAVFDVARYGWVGVADVGAPTMLGRLAGMFMSNEENSCGQFVRHVQASELF